MLKIPLQIDDSLLCEKDENRVSILVVKIRLVTVTNIGKFANTFKKTCFTAGIQVVVVLPIIISVALYFCYQHSL
jgi:hypothetical protein